MPSIYKPVQFCPKGHDTFISGKFKNGLCKLCSVDLQFCLHGHDTFICGRDKWNGCRDYNKEKGRKHREKQKKRRLL